MLELDAAEEVGVLLVATPPRKVSGADRWHATISPSAAIAILTSKP